MWFARTSAKASVSAKKIATPTFDASIRENLLTRNGVVSIVSAISPYREVRDEVRNDIGDNFVEVYVEASLDELVRRDVKGLYEKAIKGEIPNFTGVLRSLRGAPEP